MYILFGSEIYYYKCVWWLHSNWLKRSVYSSIVELKYLITSKFIVQQITKIQYDEFKCNFCDFLAKTQSGLKTHKKRKHPEVHHCPVTVCDFYCDKENDKFEHLKTHC